MYHLSKYGIAILFLIFLSTDSFTQKSYSDFKKELRSLNGSNYISKSFEGAELLAKDRDYKHALDLIKKGVKKSRSISSSTEMVVLLNKADLIARLFPKEDKYLLEIQKSIEKMSEKDPPSSLVENAISIYESLKGKVDDVAIRSIDEEIVDLKVILQKRDLDLIADDQKSKLEEFKKLKSEVAFEELNKLKVERERLEALQTRLSESVNKSELQLARRANQINKMSRNQAKKEAVIQFNMRIIDSLKFMAELDSVNLINNKNLIEQQNSRLQLQESLIQLKDVEISLKSSKQRLYLALSLLGLAIAGFLSWFVYSGRRTNKQLSLKNEEIELEKERSEKLLLNILPNFIAQELKENDKVKTRTISQCTVVFTDFINFSSIAKVLSPEDLIGALDECFREFDHIISKHNIEKIKTIGDSYMCAGGVPVSNKTHAVDAVNAAYEMIEYLDEWNLQREKDNKIRFDARIGIHSGPIIAGVVGAKKFAYDIWGDTVNVAARLESQSVAQRINISDTTYHLIKEHYQCIKRGSVSVKNMTNLEMYFVGDKMEKASLN